MNYEFIKRKNRLRWKQIKFSFLYAMILPSYGFRFVWKELQFFFIKKQSMNNYIIKSFTFSNKSGSIGFLNTSSLVAGEESVLAVVPPYAWYWGVDILIDFCLFDWVSWIFGYFLFVFLFFLHITFRLSSGAVKGRNAACSGTAVKGCTARI